ncbi:MAG: radical SAM protein [Spirochaetes bacterium]|jgi:wyosine [tRNA(Phe)-imidazoG37] synthetase (radical SAM superfamily)|nr:radical SAM protein [Spirochaetota bacterium]
MKHLFGPVNSRRLGISLGIDLVPFKTCSLNCVYCECGKTSKLTTSPAEFASTDEVIAELRMYLDSLPRLDAITFSGSGEPTLHSGIGRIIDVIKDEFPGYTVVVLTNGTLLWREAVRRSLLRADIIVPSLDAVSEDAFKKIARPAPGVTAKRLMDGLVGLRDEFAGKLLLEIFIVPGVNDTDAELRLLAEACGRIRPERVQINSLDRPGAEKWVEPLSAEGLERIKGFFQGFAVDIIGKPGTRGDMELARKKSDLTMAVTATIERRPSTIDDLCRALGASAGEVETVIAGLSSKGLLEVNELRRGTFYSIKKRD